MKKLGIPLVISLIAETACWPFSGDDPLAAMTLRKEGTGKIEIIRGAERIVVGDEDVPVEAGDLVQTFSGALAQVALEGDRVAWVGGTKELVVQQGAPIAQMRILDTMSVESQTGTILAEAEEPMKVRFGDAVATATEAVFRVDRRAGSARAASYSGTVRLTAPGEPNVTVDRLFQAPATASDLRDPQPYRIDPEDPFDLQRLESIIQLEAKLGQLSAGFANQLDRQKPDLAYFRALADGDDVSAMKRFIPNTAAVDLLLGFTVAAHSKLPFSKAVRDAFGYRNEGGTWGVVAAILRSDPRLLVADLNSIIVASQVVAGGTGGDVEFTVAAAEAAEAGEGSAPIEEVPPPGGGGEPPPEDEDDEEEPKDPDDEPEECTSGTQCDVQEVRDKIFPSPSPSGYLDDI